MKYVVLGLVVLVSAAEARAASPADAKPSATAAAPSGAKAKRKYDPSRMVCEVQEETGSRLGGRKICQMASEWAEQRRLDREALEKNQRYTTPPVN